MEPSVFFGQLGLGLTLGLAGIGSALGIGTAGRAAAGAWTKEAKAGKPLNFLYIALASMPLSQTLYGFLFMLIGLKSRIVDNPDILTTHGGTLFGLGLACGIAELFSAWLQGLVGASACRALSEGENKQIFTNMIIAMGVVETVGLFGFIFLMFMLPPV